MKPLVILVAALSLACGAAQAAERSVGVTVDGQTIQVPLPEGYCAPTGAYVERARTVAALDEANETLLTLYDCATMAAGGVDMPRYAHLKFPRSARGQTLTMDQVRDAFPDAPSDFARLLNEAVDEKALGKEFSDLSRADVKVEVGGLKPVGEDATGVYLAGVMTLQVNGTTRPLAAAVGASSVKGKLVSFNAYAQGGTVQDLATQLALVRSAVTALGAANR